MRTIRIAILVLLLASFARAEGPSNLDFEADGDVGGNPQAAVPAAPLSERGLANLVAFTRLLGYVRYFHPSPESTVADWDAIAISGVSEVEQAKTPDALAKALMEVFAPIAPTVRVYAGDQKPDMPNALKAPENASSARIAHWTHKGVGPTDPNVRSAYSSKIEEKRLKDGKIPDGFADPDEPFIADLGGGVSCMVPLSLYVSSKSPKDESDSDDDEPTKHLSAEDRSVRLADVAQIWNVYQHFYPYFDVVKVDWAGALADALKSAATDKDEREFLRTLRTLVAKTSDGHGNVIHASDDNARLPVLWTWVGEELVILKTDSEKADAPKRGEVVERIDGKPVAELYANAEKLISGATPDWRRWRGLSALATGASGTTAMLTLRSPGGARREVKLTRGPMIEPLVETRPEKIAEVKPGIYYVDVGRINDKDYADAIKDLSSGKGIIFDFRGYPRSLGFGWINNLIQESATSPQWHFPMVTKPDRIDLAFEQSPGWMLNPMPPYLKAKRAFLIDGRAISYAESCMGIVEHYKLGEIVGQPTAGTNGNINPVTFSGGYKVIWTGMKVLKQDGSRHHGVGIKPTVPVSPTIEGIAAGRDEILEKAIEVVSN